MIGRVARASPELANNEDSVVKNIRLFRDRPMKEREERKIANQGSSEKE